MRRIECPVPPEELARLYIEEKLTDEEIVTRLGEPTTLKRVRSWRKHYGIRTLERAERNTVTPIEGRLQSILVGSMLGDGRLSRTPHAARYQENHSDAQHAYIEWKAREWGQWVQAPLAPVVWRREGREFPGWRFHTVSHASLVEWHERFYDGDGPKHLTREVLHVVDSLVLAVWFMDDGSVGWWPRITFGMDPVSQGIAMGVFDQFGFRPRWEVCKGNTGVFHLEGEEQALRFIALVKPHMPECMTHKLTFGFQGPHYQVRQVLTPKVLREMSAKGVPIKRIARELGQTETTVRRHLVEHGIQHPRQVGRPRTLP
jgi:hypothetical protein